MSPQWHKEPSEEEKAKKSSYANSEALDIASKKMRSVWFEIHPHRKWNLQRAIGKDALIIRKIRTLRKALRPLWDFQYACGTADAAEEALIKASEAHGNHPDSKKASEALEKAKQGKQEADDVKKEATKALEDIIKEVKEADAKEYRNMNNDFGTGQTMEYWRPEHPMRKEYDTIRQFLKDTNYMLELKSVPNFTRALSYWEAAFEKQRTITIVHMQISDFYDMASAEFNGTYHTNGVTMDRYKEGTKKLEELKDSIAKVFLNKQAEAAHKGLLKTFRDMADERKKVEGRKERQEKAQGKTRG